MREPDERGAGHEPVEVGETPLVALATDEAVRDTAFSSFAGTLARGVLLITLGVASHLWIDARRAALSESDTVMTTLPAGPTAGDLADEPADAGRLALARLVQVGTAQTAVSEAWAVGPDSSEPHANVADHQSMRRTRLSSEPRSAVRTTGTLPSSVATRPRAPELPHESDAASDVVPAFVEAPTAAAEPQQPAWRLINAVHSAPTAGMSYADFRKVGVAPLSADLPVTRTIDAAPAVALDAAPATAVNVTDPDEHSIRLVLEQYQRAFNQLDVQAASTVWPDVDRRALARAFSHLESQSITLENCGVTLASSAAHATCRGVATYLPKVGRGPLRLTREWNFTLARKDSDWRIQSVH